MPSLSWEAEYNDGEVIHSSPDLSVHRLDRTKLVKFSLILTDTHLPLITLHLEPRQRLIYRRRVEMTIGKPQRVCHLVGWQQTVKGENTQSILYVFEDGSWPLVHWAGKFKKDHPWFYPPKLRPFEVED